MNGNTLEAVSCASSSEIKDEYVEGGSIIICLIWFQSDSDEGDEFLTFVYYHFRFSILIVVFS